MPTSLAGLLVLLLLVGACSWDASRSADGRYGITIETQPSPPRKGRLAQVTLQLKHADGRPLTGARVTFKVEQEGLFRGSTMGATEEQAPGVYGGAFIPSNSGTYQVTVLVDGSLGRGQQVIDLEVR